LSSDGQRALLSLPPSVCVRLTRRCNAGCAFCQAPDTDREVVTLSQFRALCVWLRSGHVRSVKLSGGEPTVRRDLPQIVGVAAGEGLKVTVITNGIRLDGAVLEALVAGAGEMKFSVHGLGADHDLALGRPVFDRVLQNVRRARDAGVPCSINSVITRGNQGSLRALVDLAAGLGCRKISFIPFVPRGRGAAHRSAFELSSAAYREVATEVDDLAEEFGGTIVVRQIDLRAKPYWIVENDLRLVRESWIEEQDHVVLPAAELRRLLSGVQWVMDDGGGLVTS
jgi:MoaA/NifB/PqqE/SkfB family radical SAM enzyme